MFVLHANRHRAATLTALCKFLIVSCVLFATLLATRADASFTISDFNAAVSTGQAAGHPNLTLSIDPNAARAWGSGDALSDVTIEAPAGFQLHSSAAAPCSDAQLVAADCPGASKVGSLTIRWRTLLGLPVSMSGNGYLVTPPAQANAAEIGFVLKAFALRNVIVRARVLNAVPAIGPSQLRLTTLPRSLTTIIGIPFGATVDHLEATIDARANTSANGLYFTLNPSSCGVNTLQATFSSYAGESVPRAADFTTTGCDAVPFTPSSTVAPTSTAAGQPTGVSAGFSLDGADAIVQQSAVNTIVITSPSGVSLNPAAIDAVPELCDDATLAAGACPAGSAIGDLSLGFRGAGTAWSGQLDLLERSGEGFRIGGAARAGDGSLATVKGDVAAIDSDGDGAPDSVRMSLNQLPGAVWSTASFVISEPLLHNDCPTGDSSTTLTAASGAAVTQTSPWVTGFCEPPDTQITSAPAALSSNASPSVGFTSDPETGTTFECSWDDGPWGACGSSAQPPAPLADGPHQFCVRASNAVLTDPTPACATFTVDTTPPTVNINSPANGSSQGPFVQLTFTATDSSGVVAVTCSLDGAPPTPCTSGALFDAGAPGYASIRVCATDAAGNVGCSIVTFTTTGQSMNVTITAGPPDVTTAQIASFTYRVNTPVYLPDPCEDNGQPCIQVIVPLIDLTCRFDGGAVFACPLDSQYGGTYTTPPLTEGSHQFCVTAVRISDGLTSTDCRQFTVALPPPPPATPHCDVTNNNVRCTFTVPDGYVATCRLDAEPSAACTSPWTRNGVSAGTHTFRVCLTDQAGNVGCGNFTFSVPVPLIVMITSPANGSIISAQSVSVNYTAIGVTQCDKPPSPFDAALTEGPNTITITCSNASGSTTSASVTVTRDTVPPVIGIVSPANGSTIEAPSVTLSFVAVDATTTVVSTTCSLDSGPATACISPVNYGNLSTGSHTISVTALDAAGNSRTESVNFTRILPLQLYPGCPIGPIASASIVCNPSASGGVPPYTFTCRIDAGPWTSCSQQAAIILPPGAHTIAVCVTDARGVTVCATASVVTGDTGGGGGGISPPCPPGVICTTSTPEGGG